MKFVLRALTTAGILVAGYAIFWLAQLFFATFYERVVSGAVHERYSQMYVMETEDGLRDLLDLAPSDELVMYLVRVDIDACDPSSFSPYRLTQFPEDCMAVIAELREFPVIYNVVDIYQVSKWGSVRNVALCGLCNQEGLDDILFEKSLPTSMVSSREHRSDFPIVGMPFDDGSGNACQWTKERYEQVINSPRCKLRKEIIKHIAPGDRTKNVSGWWWNW